MKLPVISLIVLLLLHPAAAFCEEPSQDDGVLKSDTSWSGEVTVEKMMTVPKDVTLKVEPGASVRFARGAGLLVYGVLAAEGTKESPVTFTSSEESPGAGSWKGIDFTNAGEGSCLRNCNVEYAETVYVRSCEAEISGCLLTNGMVGVSVEKRSALIKDNRITSMQTGGVGCSLGASPSITGNVMEDCGGFGINVVQSSSPDVEGNSISGCGMGLTANRAEFPIKGNTFSRNKAGIIVTNCGPGMEISGNRLEDNETGLVCQQFSNPVVDNNLIKGSQNGIVCFMSSNPNMRHNEVTGNKDAISCLQMCNPVITANRIYGNERGIYLHLSSFAVINGNDIYDNAVQVELDNMSSDWENRVRVKPERGAQAQNDNLADRGKAVRRFVPEDATFRGYVDATGNWWGDPATAEMDLNGPEANIDGFRDYYDEPTRVYEGYEGEYVQDYIKYEGWLTAPATGAGLRTEDPSE